MHALFKAVLIVCAGIVVHCIWGNQDIRYIGGCLDCSKKISVYVNVKNCKLNPPPPFEADRLFDHHDFLKQEWSEIKLKTLALEYLNTFRFGNKQKLVGVRSGRKDERVLAPDYMEKGLDISEVSSEF